jgi:uncharacterized protein with HEPN domain
MIGAADRIENWLGDVDYRRFIEDEFLRSAIERQLEIVSEASRHIPDPMKDERPDISWREMAQLGNILRHRYFAVDPETIWRIATLDMPALREMLAKWRARGPDAAGA